MLLATGSLVLCAFTTKPDQENVTITLIVDTEQIDNKNTATTCHFDGQAENVTNENFTVDVNIGDVITWQGASSTSETDVVEITKIKFMKGNNIFGRDLGPGNGGKISAKTAAKGSYKYDISFKVTHAGKASGTFHIDPVIQAH